MLVEFDRGHPMEDEDSRRSWDLDWIIYLFQSAFVANIKFHCVLFCFMTGFLCVTLVVLELTV